ncbi:MAG: TetR/AcrR family transcriptional regulator C-terminal domain-containing protein [Alphaproteobacteria bacterium]
MTRSDGGADEVRGKGSGRRPLDRDRIAAAALRLIDAEGLDGLSTRKLGRALGVEAMSLYHHFASKGDLLDAVAERLLSDVAVPAWRPGADWVDWIRQLARSYRAVALRHPNAFLLLAGRRFNTDAAFRFLETHLGVLADAGFDPPSAARVFRTVGYFLNGAGLADVATLTAAADRSAPPRMETLAHTEDFPHVRRAAPHLARPALDGIFEFGLETLLDALARAPKRRPPDTARHDG